MAVETKPETPPPIPAGQPAPSPAPDGKILGKFTSVDELTKSYGELEKKLGNYSELEGKAKLADQYSQYGDPQRVLEWALWGAQEHQRRQAAPAAAQSAAPTQDPFADWEVLTAREQAGRLGQLAQAAKQEVMREVMGQVNQLAQQYAQQVGRQWSDSNQNMQRQWDLYRKVIDVARKNPSVDPEQLLQTMVKVATGSSEDLMGLAMRTMTGELDAETRAKALFESYKIDQAQKQKNQSFAALTGTNGPGWASPELPTSREDAKSFVLKQLLEKGTISPDQV